MLQKVLFLRGKQCLKIYKSNFCEMVDYLFHVPFMSYSVPGKQLEVRDMLIKLVE